MPVVSDYAIVLDEPVRIGDGQPVFERRFGTGGARSRSQPVLMLMVRGLTDRAAEIRLNEQVIGVISPSPTFNADMWFAQHFAVRTGILSGASSSTANELQINAVGENRPSAGNQFDDFEVRDIVCMFQQDA